MLNMAESVNVVKQRGQKAPTGFQEFVIPVCHTVDGLFHASWEAGILSDTKDGIMQLEKVGSTTFIPPILFLDSSQLPFHGDWIKAWCYLYR